MTVEGNQAGGFRDGRGQRLSGLVALVTGAGGSDEAVVGCGAAIARLFAAQGATVGVLDVSPGRAAQTLRRIHEEGGKGMALPADITDEAAVQAAVSTLAERAGGIDIVVNNAAVTGAPASILDTDLVTWERLLRINSTGAMVVSKAVYPYLVRSDAASILNISSVAANRGVGVGAYAVSKAAVQALAADLAFKWGRDGIRVNSVAPGHIFATLSSSLSDEARLERREGNLLGTEGGAWDVAWAALYLSSPEARWLTGVVLPVDGGVTATTPVALSRGR